MAIEQSSDRASKTRLLFISAEGLGEIADFNDRHDDSFKSQVFSFKF